MKNNILSLVSPSALTLLFFLLLIGCSPSSIEEAAEDLSAEELEEIIEEENQEQFGSFTAQVNGALFKTPNLEDFARASISTSPTLYVVAISAIDIQEGITNAKVIALVIYGTDFNDFKVGAVFDEKSEDFISNGAGAGYAANSTNDNEDDDVGVFDNDELDEIYIKITGLDMEKQLFSGEFSFKGTNVDTNTEFNITDGVFTDIPFELQEN